METIFGGFGPDNKIGTDADELFQLNSGNDTVFPGGGNDIVDGGDGIDLVRFSGAQSDYLGARLNGQFIVYGPDGYDVLQSNVELVQFGNDPPIPLTGTTGSGAFVIPGSSNDYPIATLNNPQVTEGDSGTVSLRFTVTLSRPAGPSGGSLLVRTTSDGTGMPGTDFGSFVDRPVDFNPGENQATEQVSVTIFPDSLFELNETVTLLLYQDPSVGAAGQVIPSPNLGQGRINDQDPMPTITITPATSVEGNAGTSGLNFTITLSEAAGTTIPITITTAPDGTHQAVVGVDYLAPGGTVNVPTGETTGVVTVPIVGDVDLEDDETFEVVATPFNPRDSVNASASGATGTIDNDDQFLPTLTIADAQIQEGNNGVSQLDFTITLSEPWAQQVTVVAQTGNGTATLANNDYAQAGSVVTFAPGETTGHFLVPIIGDAQVEADETLVVTLSTATNARLDTDHSAIGTILNDDQEGGTLTVAIASASVSEGNAGLRTITFAVDLSAPAASQFSVTATTVAGTAVAGEDFQAKTGTVTIAAGQTHGDFVVNLLPDQILEGDDTFTVVLSNPSAGVSITAATATGTIINDDQGTPVAINGLSITDNNGDHAWWGGALGDQILGGGGNDSLMGAAGSDVLDGGDGNDLLMGGIGGGDGPDSLIGGAGNDTAMGGDGSDTILGGAGDDLLMGDAGADTILGGNDKDLILGGSGNDYLWGEAGNDTLVGQGGDDIMVGGDGSDQLVADGGSDTLTGGAGADQFIYQGTGVADIVIADFVPGVDQVFLDSRLALTAAQADTQTQGVGADAVLSFADGGSITFIGLGTHLGDLTAVDFAIFG